MVSRFFFEHAIFSILPSLFIHCHFLDPYLFLFGHLGFSSKLSSKTTSFIHISIVSLFLFITFSFTKDCSIGSFYKTMSKNNVKNNYSSTNYAKILIKFLIKRKKKRSKKNAFISKWV